MEADENAKKLLDLCQTYSGSKLAKVLNEFMASQKPTNIAINGQLQNALHVTCANYEGEDILGAVTVLLDAGIPANSVDASLRNALHHLMLRDNVLHANHVVKLLIERETDVLQQELGKTNVKSIIQCRDIYGNSALHLLCSRPENDTPIELVRTLLENCLYVNLLDNELRTALHVLCQNTQMCNRADIAEAMIAFAFGFDLVNAESKLGNNALHYLLDELEGNLNIKEMALLLIEHGINVNSPNGDGEYPLHLLCKNYKGNDILDILKRIVERQTDEVKRKTTKENKNALHLVLQYYTHNDVVMIEVVDYLVHLGVDVRGKDNYGRIPIFYLYDRDAKSTFEAQIIKKLLDVMGKEGVTLFNLINGYIRETEQNPDGGETNTMTVPIT